MTGTCTCGAIRHAVTEEHRDALERALDTAQRLQQHDLVEHYRYRLGPCPTANPQNAAEKAPETEVGVA